MLSPRAQQPTNVGVIVVQRDTQRHKQVVLILFPPFIPNVILVSRTNHVYFPSFSLLKEKLLLISVI